MPDGADTATDLKVRTAQQVDASTILRLVHELCREKGLGEQFAADKVMTIITNVIAAGQAFVLGGGGSPRIIGTIGLDIQVDSFTLTPHMIDLWTYVTPKHRSLAAFRTLIRRAEEFAEDKGVQPRFGVYGAHDLARRKKLYESSGYKAMAILFEKE